MRLTREQTEAIRQAAQQAYGVGTDVWLFGSRVDDNKRGGDIDLLLRPRQHDRSPPMNTLALPKGNAEQFRHREARSAVATHNMLIPWASWIASLRSQ